MARQVDPVRILWLGNPPWLGSGYGQQAALFIPRLQAQGHELAVACNYGLHDITLDWGGLTCFPADGVYGTRTMPTWAADYQADLVLALCDAWVLKPGEWPPGPPVALWAPVDHSSLPAMVRDVLAHDRIRPVAMSRFGERLMRAERLNPFYVPHGVDTQLFRPHPELRGKARADLGVPEDAFLVGMVAANVGNPSAPRKAFNEAFAAAAEFAGRHRDAWFYCHSEGNPRPGAGGINLHKLAGRRGLPEGRIRIPTDETWHRGIPHGFVAYAYQAMDVLVHCSMGEGFGLAGLEAQACGVPVISSDHSAMTELCGAGWLVDGQPWNDEAQEADFTIPIVSSIVDRLEQAYTERGNADLRTRAVEFAQAFDADRVAETFWRPVLDELAGGAPASVPPAGPNRAQRRANRKVAV
jgi:glycosyltransferase involved in cell wall biosynthesis